MNPERKRELDDAWMEALLSESYRTDEAQDRSRVARVMQSIFSDASHLDAVTSGDARPGQLSGLAEPKATRALLPAWFNFRTLSALALAASLLFFVFIIVDQGAESQAYAAVVRCTQAKPTLRQYRMEVVNQRPLIGERTIVAQLYFNEENRFVAEHPAPQMNPRFGGNKMWIGGDAHERWIVPPRGNAIIGPEDTVGRWLAGRDIASPYLHMNTILERMTRAYSLSLLPDETIRRFDNEDKEIHCEHIHATLKVQRPMLPLTIDLWSDIESGLVERMVLQWSGNGNRVGPLSWTLDRVDPDPNLPKNWFDVEAHAQGRVIRRAKSSSDLDELQ